MARNEHFQWIMVTFEILPQGVLQKKGWFQFWDCDKSRLLQACLWSLDNNFSLQSSCYHTQLQLFCICIHVYSFFFFFAPKNHDNFLRLLWFAVLQSDISILNNAAGPNRWKKILRLLGCRGFPMQSEISILNNAAGPNRWKTILPPFHCRIKLY